VIPASICGFLAEYAQLQTEFCSAQDSKMEFVSGMEAETIGREAIAPGPYVFCRQVPYIDVGGSTVTLLVGE
jgi:hypothetical protein